MIPFIHTDYAVDGAEEHVKPDHWHGKDERLPAKYIKQF